jgi:hypothetical protein
MLETVKTVILDSQQANVPDARVGCALLGVDEGQTKLQTPIG